MNHHWSGTALRIASMNRSELLDRTRQEFRKRLDAILFGLGINPSAGSLRTETVPGKFFFCGDAVPQLVNLLVARLPQHAETITTYAERICRHRFDLLGYEDLDYGREIDWHSDRVHKKRAPEDLWFKIRYLDFASVGDSKITWELNRHQHLVTLAKAYRLTGDDRFAVESLAQWRDWQTKNPYPRGINWASSLEVAFRSLSWLWVYFLLENTPAMVAEFRRQWLRAMELSGRHVELYLSTYFSPNTHLLGEALALFAIGALCPELPDSSRWKRRGWQILLRESERQVRPDGFYFEQSTYYHLYALDILLHARLLASRNDMPFPPEVDSRIEQMMDALAVLCRAGHAPRFGDDDGGRLFDPRRNRPENLRDPLATGAVLFDRGDFKFLSNGLHEELIWLLGEPGVVKFDAIEEKLSKMNSLALPAAGLYLMSSAEGKLQGVIDAGPQGALRAGHGHADALSLNINCDGRQWFGDPGTCEYVGPATDRDQFRGTAFHNTLQLDGANQSNPSGPFAWELLTNTTVETWINGEYFDYFVGSHDGYTHLKTPLVHRRSVFFLKSKFWLVRDSALGAGTHRLVLRWHLNPQLPPMKSGSGGTFLPGDSNGIAIFSSTDQSWSGTVEPTVWSSVYGVKEPAVAIAFAAEVPLPAEFATLLFPVTASVQAPSDHRRLTRVPSPSQLSAYRFIQNEERHCFIFAQDQVWTFEDWKSDAEFLYYSSANGKFHLLVLCNASFIEFRGKRLVYSSECASRCEMFCAPGDVQLLCSGELLVSPEDVKKFFGIDEQPVEVKP